MTKPRTADDRKVGTYVKVCVAEYPRHYPHNKSEPEVGVIGAILLIKEVFDGRVAVCKDKDGGVWYIDLIHLNPQCPQNFEGETKSTFDRIYERESAARPYGFTVFALGYHIFTIRNNNYALFKREPSLSAQIQIAHRVVDGDGRVLKDRLTEAPAPEPLASVKSDDAVDLRTAPPVTAADLFVTVQTRDHSMTTASVVGAGRRVVYTDPSLGLVWVVNPLTGHVCRVDIRDLSPTSRVRLEAYRFNGPSTSAAPKPEPVKQTDKGEFILWNPKSRLAPSVKYGSKAEAVKVARLMAGRHKGETFHICRLEGGAKASTRKVQRTVTEEVTEVQEL